MINATVADYYVLIVQLTVVIEVRLLGKTYSVVPLLGESDAVVPLLGKANPVVVGRALLGQPDPLVPVLEEGLLGQADAVVPGLFGQTDPPVPVPLDHIPAVIILVKTTNLPH